MKDFQRPPKTIPRSIGHRAEWIEACKEGKPEDAKAGFAYSGPFTEALLVGNLAVAAAKADRVGRRRHAGGQCAPGRRPHPQTLSRRIRHLIRSRSNCMSRPAAAKLWKVVLAGCLTLAVWSGPSAAAEPPPDLKRANVEALRRAIDDLVHTFGSRYARGAEFLTRVTDYAQQAAAIEAAAGKGGAQAARGASALAEKFERLQREALWPIRCWTSTSCCWSAAARRSSACRRTGRATARCPATATTTRSPCSRRSGPDGKLTTLFRPEERRVRRRRGPALRRRQDALLHARHATAAGRSARSRPTARACAR